MKRTPSEDELMDRLGPSKFSAAGFLGTDHRPVSEIIADDLRTLEQAGVTVEKLVAVLSEAYRKAREAMGAEVQAAPGVTAVFHESMGRIPSPFRGDGVFEKGDAVLTHDASGQSLVVTRLGLALIEAHQFFQGRGSRYRVDPSVAIRMFGLGEGP